MTAAPCPDQRLYLVDTLTAATAVIIINTRLRSGARASSRLMMLDRDLTFGQLKPEGKIVLRRTSPTAAAERMPIGAPSAIAQSPWLWV